MSDIAVDFRDVDIVFGDRWKEALTMAEGGMSRSDILSRTGAVIGCVSANLTVREGEISVLMGLSGSGKSTLLRAVNGLNKVVRGQVMVRDRDELVDVVSCDAATLRRVRQRAVAMVFQQFGLLPWRTVAQNVALGLELSGMPEGERNRKVRDKLELVGLEQWANKYAHELSGGMQQRVGLARAFATDAPILLMDEPFSALDPLIRTKLQDELLLLQKSLKKTIIFVSHDLEEALKLGNCISILEGGRIVQSGAPEDIVLRPSNDYVSDFIANVNPLSVLTAWNVMRDVRDSSRSPEGWIWLDKRQTTRLRLGPGGEALEAERDGVAANWVHCREAADPPVPGSKPCYWASPGTPLKTVMLAMHRSETAPVALFDDEHRYVGSIGVADVLHAVLGREIG